MHSTKSMGRIATRASAVVTIVALAILLGVNPTGMRAAFAQQDVPGSAGTPEDAVVLVPQGLDEVIENGEAQVDDAIVLEPEALDPLADEGDVEQNYAVFDPSTGTLTFQYGALPPGTAGTDYYVGFDTATTPYAGDGDRPWYPKKTSIKHVVFDASVSGHLKPLNTAWWFGQFYSLEDVVGLGNLDMSNVASMAHMFDNCNGKLTTLDLSVLDTSNVTDMTGLLNGCQRLTTLTLGGSFSTANVRGMDSMFSSCNSLVSLDVSGFDTTNAQTMCSMFDGCSKLTSLDLSSFNTLSGSFMDNMFGNCPALQSVTLGKDFSMLGHDIWNDANAGSLPVPEVRHVQDRCGQLGRQGAGTIQILLHLQRQGAKANDKDGRRQGA